ncbi:MAG: cupin domain-containing protein [Methylococcaceae bacterium]|nr:cupin domain-containing protein [Methylococcaceae bacterium]
MKITKIKLLMTAAIVTVSMVTFADNEDNSLVNLPVTKLKYFESGFGPLQAAPAYGNLANGAHGTFIKLPAGFISPAHIHSEDYHAVVISGVVANGVPGSKMEELPVGSYYFQKGGEGHISKCLSANECVLFLSQPGKFDYLPDTQTHTHTRTHQK